MTIENYKKLLWYIILGSSIIEMMLFPGWNNFILCLLAVVCLFMYSIVINKRIVLLHFFSFLCYTTLFMYRFLPIVGTLLDGNPISIGYQNPYDVFYYESLTFLVATLAFFICARSSINSSNILTKLYLKIGLFKKLSEKDFWVLGIIGVGVDVLCIFVPSEEINKILQTMSFFRYAPLCLVFPSLCGFKTTNHKRVYLYLLILTLLSLTKGSREVLLFPICTYIILYCLNKLRSNEPIINTRRDKNKLKIIILIPIILLSISLFNRISLAMLLARDVVFSETSTASDVVESTITNMFNDKEILETENKMFNMEEGDDTFSLDEWNEQYISNSFLNRYCNLRLTDQTLVRAKTIGFNNPVMLDNFILTNSTFLPTPILKMLGINVNKQDFDYSRGDLLFALSRKGSIFRSNVVTSHVADGLATFGLMYFPIQFIIWFIMFKLIDSLTFKSKNKLHYSIYGLCNVFVFFGLTRAANGCSRELFYCLRLFWNGILGCIIIYFLLKIINGLLNVNRIK